MRRDDDGYAVLEALLLGAILLLPLVWLLGVSADVHRAALASATAAREATMTAARTTGTADGASSARAAIARALEEGGVEASRARISLSWRGSPARGQVVEVRLEVPVRIMRIPLFEDSVGPSIAVRARHIARADPYRSDG